MSIKEEYTAIDMATAAADGFRDGQRAAQSAPVGEREAEAAAIAEEIDWLIRQWDAGANWSGERMAELLEAAGKAAEMLTAQQRTQAVAVPEAKVTGAWESARIGDFNAGWNACRDSVFTLMKKAAYMELDTTKRSIATQDELRALLAAQPQASAAQSAPAGEREAVAAQDQGEVQELRELLVIAGSVLKNSGYPKIAARIDAALAASTRQEE